VTEEVMLANIGEPSIVWQPLGHYLSPSEALNKRFHKKQRFYNIFRGAFWNCLPSSLVGDQSRLILKFAQKAKQG
jgi:hypothetical protein